MKRKTILATMIGLAFSGVIAAGPASAQPYDGHSDHARTRHVISQHDHYAAWVTQQRKLRAQHERWADHQQDQRGGPGNGAWHDGRH